MWQPVIGGFFVSSRWVTPEWLRTQDSKVRNLMWLGVKELSHKKLVCAMWSSLSQHLRLSVLPTWMFTILPGRDSIDAPRFMECQRWGMNASTCSYSQWKFKSLPGSRPCAGKYLKVWLLQLSSNRRMGHWIKAGSNYHLNVDGPHIFLTYCFLCELLCTSLL